MPFNKKILVSLALITFVILGLAATRPPKDHTFKNLKVLPKNIAAEDLYRIMHEFNNDLGVKCSFCHAPSESDPKQMDFASDKIDHKDIARGMMRMTKKINKKFFHVKKPAIGDSTLIVTCFTCHHGAKEPEKITIAQK